jgi:hypothetical protein
VALSAHGFAALSEIAREAPETQRDLAARLGLRPSTTSELLKRLQRRDLVRLEAGGHQPGPPAETGAMSPAVTLVVVPRVTPELRSHIRAPAWDIGFQHECVLATVILPEEEFEHGHSAPLRS